MWVQSRSFKTAVTKDYITNFFYYFSALFTTFFHRFHRTFHFLYNQLSLGGQVVRMLEEVGFQAGAPLAERKVLAFAPETLPLRLDTEQQVRAALMGLLQVCS